MKPRPKAEDGKHRGSGKLRNKVALITGGDSGIGRAVAIAFAKEGADIAVVYLDEKKDAEELSLLRNTQEHSIFELQLQIKQQQLEAARQSLAALQEGLKNARSRETHYQQLLSTGLTAHEQAQIAGMVVGQVFSQVANVIGIASSVAHFVPQVGSPFAMSSPQVSRTMSTLPGLAPSALGLPNALSPNEPDPPELNRTEASRTWSSQASVTSNPYRFLISALGTLLNVHIPSSASAVILSACKLNSASKSADNNFLDFISILKSCVD